MGRGRSWAGREIIIISYHVQKVGLCSKVVTFEEK